LKLAGDSMSTELISLEELCRALDGRELPGAELTIEGYESTLADYALLAPASSDDTDTDTDTAHPFWLLVLALRGMGISVPELGALAGQRSQDTLLFGHCELAQHRGLAVGHRFRTTAVAGPVARKQSRGGGVLDFVTVRVQVVDLDDPGGDGPVGTVTSGYIFKRGV
jgi:hypothetical protein